MTESSNQRRPLGLKKNYYDSAADTQSGTDTGQNNGMAAAIKQQPAFAKRNAAKLRRRRLLITIGWLFSAALAAVLLYLRFFATLPAPLPDLEVIKRCGMMAIGGVYLCSIFLALKDNMFDGLLALVVPFYPFYYLFFSSGSILLRALSAALLAAFGFDCLLFLQDILTKVADHVSAWIQNM